MSIVYNPQETSVISSVLFGLDIYLLLDILTQIVAYGLIGEKAYLNNLIILKIVYMATQIYLFITFFTPHQNYSPLIVLFRLCRLWCVLCYVEKLTETLNTVLEILFHPKLKIYRVYLFGIPLSLMGMALASRYVQGEVDGSGENTFFELVSNGMSYAYGLGWSFISEESTKQAKNV